MKKNKIVIILGALSIGLLVGLGCQADMPVDNHASASVKGDISGIADTNGEVLFRMPKPKNGNNKESITKLVSPNDTTEFHCKLSYQSISNKSVSFDVKFKIPSGAVSDTVRVTVTLDTVLARIIFKPDGLQFLKPASIDVSLKNLDPITVGTLLGFLYVNPDGTFGPQEYERLSVDLRNGSIDMKNGKIRHFSSYGFGRLTQLSNDK